MTVFVKSLTPLRRRNGIKICQRKAELNRIDSIQLSRQELTTFLGQYWTTVRVLYPHAQIIFIYIPYSTSLCTRHSSIAYFSSDFWTKSNSYWLGIYSTLSICQGALCLQFGHPEFRYLRQYVAHLRGSDWWRYIDQYGSNMKLWQVSIICAVTSSDWTTAQTCQAHIDTLFWRLSLPPARCRK